jgi:hypothetical protein
VAGLVLPAPGACPGREKTNRFRPLVGTVDERAKLFGKTGW